MSVRKLFAVCSFVVLSGAMAPAMSQINLSVDINTAPPPPRVEVIPAQRPGYLWAPGYWRWEGNRHIWVGGRWMEARRGYHYVGEHWELRNGRHHFEPGRWEPEHGRDSREREFERHERR